MTESVYDHPHVEKRWFAAVSIDKQRSGSVNLPGRPKTFEIHRITELKSLVIALTEIVQRFAVEDPGTRNELDVVRVLEDRGRGGVTLSEKNNVWWACVKTKNAG